MLGPLRLPKEISIKFFTHICKGLVMEASGSEDWGHGAMLLSFFFFFLHTLYCLFFWLSWQIHGKDDLSWERFIGAHGLREQSHMAWAVRWQTQEVGSHTVSAVGKQRKLIPRPHWLFPFYSVRVPSTMVPPTFRVSCPSSANSFWKHSHIDICFHRVCNSLDNEG